jgi:hypothetical protein
VGHPNSNAIRAACAPLAIVLAYAVAVAARPEVGLADIAFIAEGHLTRNILLLLFLLLIVLLASKLAKQEGRPEIWFIAGDFLRARWQEDRLLSVLLPPIMLALMLASFTMFKQQVLPLAGFGLDDEFAAIDRAIFFGVDPWQLTHAIAPSWVATQILDWAYILWFVPLLAFVLLSWIAPLKVRTQFLVAFVLIWILMGTILAFLLPGSGPCYYQAFHGSADFAPLMDRLRMQEAMIEEWRGIGLSALLGQQSLLDFYHSRELMLAGGISAMPSLHNAFAVLFACVGFRYSRWAGLSLSAFAAVIWFASVHLGWHYAIDGIVGGILAVLVWRLAGVIASAIIERKPKTEALPGLDPLASPIEQAP